MALSGASPSPLVEATMMTCVSLAKFLLCSRLHQTTLLQFLLLSLLVLTLQQHLLRYRFEKQKMMVNLPAGFADTAAAAWAIGVAAALG